MMQLEHIALNVPDPPAMVEWYKRNLKMTVKRAGGPPTYTTFVADVSGNIVLELFCNTSFPMLDFAMLDPMSLHLAFMTDSIERTRELLVDAGATVADDITSGPTGDEIMMLQDPWGFALQFVHRAVPMLPQQRLRPEHVAFNVRDSRAQAAWYRNEIGLHVKRESGAPGYGFFLSDSGHHMMLELYQNSDRPVLDMPTISHMSIHLAFMVDDILAAKKALTAKGATVAEDLSTTPSGDHVLMMRDPWGLSIQLAKRVVSMLE
jgi:catechol 2,3-dioxygenase-like lactoylglutathione lyase family enzyme